MGISVAVLMVVAMGLVVGSDYFLGDRYLAIQQFDADHSNTRELGFSALYTISISV